MAPDKRAGVLALGAVEARDRIAKGALSAVEYLDAFLARIAETEPAIQAWTWLDGDSALAQARALDARRQSGAAIGPMHGLPVGIKDIIDTRGIPTENGLAVDAGRVPTRDAGVVQRLRAAGAIILGKTVTAQGAFLDPGKTRNPHNSGHTPGGSSSGSAAAVASGMVPLALGTQTGGSVIRPASYCGITGFKPSFGLIGRSGILAQSPFLDTVGVMARSIEDAALIAEVIAGHDPDDPATRPDPSPRLLAVAQSRPPVRPTLAFVEPPGFAEAHPDLRDAMEELVGLLGESCFRIGMTKGFDHAEGTRRQINLAEMAKCYYGIEKRAQGTLPPLLTAALEEGRGISARDYLAALDWREVLNAGLDEVFERCDAILTPAATGPAPEGLGSTGSGAYNGLWTMCGTPAVTVPLFTGATGLPMGVQLVGRRGDDARLLRTARWLVQHVEAAGGGGDTA